MAVLLLALAFSAALPVPVYASAGSLPVRIGYYGETGDYRLLCTFSYSQMDRLCDQTYKYSNVTNVGTVMGTIARGVPVTELLREAGIDPASVKTLNFRTTDGTLANNWFVSLDMGVWVNRTRYDYPKLRSSYDNSSGYVVPLPGALDGKTAVPAIIAIESFSTKSPTALLDPGLMTETDSYRFCVGQGSLEVGAAATEVTSNNSAKWIVGLDVTLKGTPADAADLSLALGEGDLIVGGQVRVEATLTGQALFEDLLDGTLTWSSSDPDIASVDADGLVTIHKAGVVTITATTSNGISRQVVLNCTTEGNADPGGDQGGDDPATPGDGGDSGNGSSGIQMREIAIRPGSAAEDGGSLVPLPEAPETPWAPAASAAAGLFFMGLGALVKLRRYHKEV